MSQKVSYIEFKGFDDLIRFISSSPMPFLHHIVINDKNLYFIQAIGFGGGRTIYFVEKEEMIKERYIIFNRFRDEVSFSDKLLSDGKSACIKILELKKTNIFPEYPLK